MPKLNQSPFFALKTLTHTPRYVTQTNHSFFFPLSMFADSFPFHYSRKADLSPSAGIL